MAPSTEFFKELKHMETHFKTYHGNNELKPEKISIHNMAEEISKYVTLPSDVIEYFVGCRLFFRMRILNRNLQKSSNKVCVSKELAKLTK